MTVAVIFLVIKFGRTQRKCKKKIGKNFSFMFCDFHENYYYFFPFFHFINGNLVLGIPSLGNFYFLTNKHDI
jgi:hypothetical protein